MTVIGALSSFRELGEMSPHKRAYRLQLSDRRQSGYWQRSRNVMLFTVFELHIQKSYAESFMRAGNSNFPLGTRRRDVYSPLPAAFANLNSQA
jgi:hypothetical protein